MFKSGNRFIGFDILLVERLPTPYSMLELTPYQTRYILVKKGWTTVVGFHTRNVCHRAHEYIILKALEMTGADGLLISPVTGPKKERLSAWADHLGELFNFFPLLRPARGSFHGSLS